MLWCFTPLSTILVKCLFFVTAQERFGSKLIRFLEATCMWLKLVRETSERVHGWSEGQRERWKRRIKVPVHHNGHVSYGIRWPCLDTNAGKQQNWQHFSNAYNFKIGAKYPKRDDPQYPVHISEREGAQQGWIPTTPKRLSGKAKLSGRRSEKLTNSWKMYGIQNINQSKSRTFT